LHTGGLVSEFLEGQREAHGVIHVFVVTLELVRHVVHLAFEQSGFHGPGTLEAPAGHGHFFDDQMFAGGDGGMGVDEGLVELQEFFAAFDGETDGVRQPAGGGEAVTGAGRFPMRVNGFG